MSSDAATALSQSWSRLWSPPPRLTLSQWADAHRKLSSESAAAPGQWVTANAEFQRGVLDAFTDPRIHTIVVMSAVQMLKTECGVLNPLGYCIDQDPGPILLVVPRDTDAKTFSKVRLAPMLRDTPRLRGRVSEAKSRDSGNTIDHKTFPGGHLRICGANSPSNLASLPIRYLFCDEIDKFPLSAAAEGDPISLAVGRTTTFWNRKIVLTCSPTLEPTSDGGGSRIARAFAESDQRHFWLPCPDCGEFQILHFGQVLPKENPEEAHYHCEACDTAWDDTTRVRMLRHGQWRASAPFNGTAGFWISALYSPWKKLREIIAEYLAKKDNPETYKAFVNTVLAETWKESGDAPEHRRLYDRREDYQQGTVPRGGLFLTAGVDVQKDRLEAEIVAWGPGKESWSVDHRVLPGNPQNEADQVWKKLDELLEEQFEHESGHLLPITKMAVDTGYATNSVYAWCRTRAPRVMAVDGRQTGSVPVGTPKAVDVTVGGKRISAGLRLWPVATGLLKSELYGWLQLEKPTDEEMESGGSFPPGYCHFPMYGEEYFLQLTAEQLVRRVVKGYPKLEWQKTRERNEALDCRVYARAAANVAGMDRYREHHWAALAEPLSREVEKVTVPQQQTVRRSEQQQRTVYRSRWMDR